ncbi:hypothetical protein BAD_1264 [Bifidobacterium adolescentis ATCC 15703]|uniref:Uncharacterized protein n=1 Tax=Bifidobacterium adolescentis (strain ATCC 15703 / DSM 20083 / NCTC 11814 / E194a) TaxID=367928 RepID=A1A2W2_BIFAA|nr:hypothetical protein BAD_1264 [Bifidobacterium adolescentis ATCC 15703]
MTRPFTGNGDSRGLQTGIFTVRADVLLLRRFGRDSPKISIVAGSFHSIGGSHAERYDEHKREEHGQPAEGSRHRMRFFPPPGHHSSPIPDGSSMSLESFSGASDRFRASSLTIRSTARMSVAVLPAFFAWTRKSSTCVSSSLSRMRAALISVNPWANASSASIRDCWDSRIAFEMLRLVSRALLLWDKFNSLPSMNRIPCKDESIRRARRRTVSTKSVRRMCRHRAPLAGGNRIRIEEPFINSQQWEGSENGASSGKRCRHAHRTMGLDHTTERRIASHARPHGGRHVRRVHNRCETHERSDG